MAGRVVRRVGFRPVPGARLRRDEGDLEDHRHEQTDRTDLGTSGGSRTALVMLDPDGDVQRPGPVDQAKPPPIPSGTGTAVIQDVRGTWRR